MTNFMMLQVVCSSLQWLTCVLCSRFHKQIVLSSDPDKSRRPSLDQAIDVTAMLHMYITFELQVEW